MSPVDAPTRRVVVVGNGMVGSRFASDLLARLSDEEVGAVEITVLGAEEYEPYNRVLLSEVVAGKVDLAAIGLPGAGDDRVRVRRGTEAIAIDRASRRVITADGAYPYDAVVLATGAAARVPDICGITGRAGGLPRGVHTLRTLDDARGIVAASANARHAVVIGAGVLGLEVACGLAYRGVPVSVVHGGASPMDRQLDTDAGRVVEASLSRLGVRTWTQARTERVRVDQQGRACGVEIRTPDGTDRSASEDGTRVVDVEADLVVLACGTVPEAGLARAAGLTVDRGVVVGEDLASPDDPRVFAIGDCAQPPEGGTGLIAQGWDQSWRLAEALASAARADDGTTAGRDRLPGRPPSGDADRPSMALRLATSAVVRPVAHDPQPGRATGSSPARAAVPGTDVVRVKAAGLEIVTMGVSGREPGHRSLTLSDPAAGRHVQVVVADGLLVGATCVGAPDVGADLTATYTRRVPVPADPAHLLLRPAAPAPVQAVTPTHMPDQTTVCHCNGVTKGDLVACWHDGARSADDLARGTRATTGCGGCTDAVCGIADWLAAADPSDDGVRDTSSTARSPVLSPSPQRS
ncbi:assimilatory nitrate reductase (NADH) beta subunit [Georgenia satyanarayanai]|uniref:Assimilatory nitrate reductase (NADH) beta subunit n=1 Tax=Georgenia satyanarayanai TaxID=860221 RepID=A0A2Y9AEQ0_9MICO|nr:FAD-dependent oxidoreductase [Georgenia satyanarayanai]PYF99778.1 assimilatory nitrate reductase (NADH) beta subunit [Georgenia satyanarayanai]SSA41758.1 assimilatory nitrate reductase (NADH) beta subunit [Georgenia satyanarayanai]